MLAGRYFINPRFATVEIKPMTEVPIANVGVVIAYVGAEGVDETGEAFKHGNLVKKGQKGVWVDPLDPGKYPINPLYAQGGTGADGQHRAELGDRENARRTGWISSCRRSRCGRPTALRSIWM